MFRRTFMAVALAAAMLVPLSGTALATNTVVQDWTVVLPRSNQQANQLLDTGVQPWPAGVNVIQARMDCTPFSGSAATRFDSESKIVDWQMQWSYDGGVTWLFVGGAEQGSPTGQWGKDLGPFPHQELDFGFYPWMTTAPQVPTHWRIQATPRQNTNFGASFRTLFRTQQ